MWRVAEKAYGLQKLVGVEDGHGLSEMRSRKPALDRYVDVMQREETL